MAKVNVSIYWGGEVLHENNSIRYSLPPKSNSKVPTTISYDRFVGILFKKMNIDPTRENILIFGRYPHSSTSQGVPIYCEWNIYGDDTLMEFLKLPEEMSIRVLEIYVRTEPHVMNEVPSEQHCVDLNVPSEFTQLQVNMLSDRPSNQFGQHSSFSPLETTYSYDASRGYEQTRYDGISQQSGYFDGCYQPEMIPSETMRGNEVAHIDELATHHDWLHQQEDDSFFTNLNNRVTNNDVADGGSEESESDIPNDADNSDDEMSFSGEESEEEHPLHVHDEGNMNYHADHIAYLDDLLEGDDVFALTREDDHIRTSMWSADKPDLQSGMSFSTKEKMKTTVKIWSIRKNREFIVDEAKGDYWKVVCRRSQEGCSWMLRARKVEGGMWKIGKYKGKHTCDMGEIRGDHFNLDTKIIAKALNGFIANNPQYKVKDCIVAIKTRYGSEPSIRKAWLGRRRAFENVYGNFDKSFAQLPRYMAALQHFNPGTVVEWWHENTPASISFKVFKYVFWAFKPCIDGFKNCRPVISIDGTHVYGKYDIKLLIAVAVDANTNVFPLAFAIVANESTETWTWFLKLLKKHVVKDRSGICLISDRHKGILSSVDALPEWNEPAASHRYCIRHLKSNFMSKFQNKHLENLMWLAATEHQVRKYRKRMTDIQQCNIEAYNWLSKFSVEKWTLCMDGGKRWGILTTNVSESFNGVLKMARGLPVTAMVRLCFSQVVKRFYDRKQLAEALVRKGQRYPKRPKDLIRKYEKRSKWHTVCDRFDKETGVYEVITGIHGDIGNNLHKVCMQEKKCDCNKLMSYHLPCSHAMKVCEHFGKNVNSLVNSHYTVANYLQTYSGLFQPLGHEAYWPQEPFKMVLNKSYLRRTGVNRRSRIPNQMDVGSSRYVRKCGSCKETGHDKRNCPTRASGSSSARH